MKEIEMIKTMFNMQKALDAAIYREHKTEYNRERTEMALLDEIGELTHELKPEWCWWKKNMKPVDRQKVLEELVDCWHFGMSLDYHEMDEYRAEIIIKKVLVYGFKEELNITRIKERVKQIMGTWAKTAALIILTKDLGFTIKDVYNEYIRKNAVNYQRLQEGY